MLELLRVGLDLERRRVEDAVDVLDVAAPHPETDEIRPGLEAHIVERESTRASSPGFMETKRPCIAVFASTRR